MNTKTVEIKWTATYLTKMEVPANATEQEIMDMAANIDIDAKDENTEYLSDTWEVEDLTIEEDEAIVES